MSLADNLILRIPGRLMMMVTWPPGWEKIIADLDEALNEVDPNYSLSQVKVKFGGLRYYFRMSESASAEDYEKARSIVDYAEKLASKTCMECGDPGQLVTTDQVLCERDERRYRSAARR